MHIVLKVRNIIIIPVKPPKTNILSVAITTAEWLYLGAGGLPVVTTLKLNINADSRISVFVDGTVTITVGLTALVCPIILISTHSYVRRYRLIAHDVTAPVMMYLEDKLAIYAQSNFCKQSKFCKTL